MNSGKIVRRNWFTFGLLCLTAAFVGILMSASQSVAQSSQVQVTPTGTPISASASPISSELITLNVASRSVSAGATATVEVQIAAPNAQPFAGWQFDLAFDTKLLQLKDVQPGDFLSRCPAQTTYFNPGKVDNAVGTLTGVGGAAIGLPQGKGCSGSGVVARLTFTVKRSGAPTYSLSNVLLLDPATQPMRAYPVYRYALAGALRQTLDPALVATQIAEATASTASAAVVYPTCSPADVTAMAATQAAGHKPPSVTFRPRASRSA